MHQFDEASLESDEMEAILLADVEGFYQADAALKMEGSHPTLGNILNSAHEKNALALLQTTLLSREIL